MVDPEKLLRLWFGPDLESDAAVAQRSRIWFQGDPEFDQQLEPFAALPDAALRGDLDAWSERPRSALALVIALDQLPRNLHRDGPRAYAFDALARRRAEAAIERGFDRQVHPLEASFFYLPLEHAEDVEAQRACVAQFRRLLDRAPEATRHHYANFVDYAERHREVIDRFGRFPHRNRVLGRESTDAELRYLVEGGETFGGFASAFESGLRELLHYQPFRFPAAEIPTDYRAAAVLIPFWRESSGLRVVMTRRAESVPDHKGQVAFAGGRLNPGESWEQAALREAQEEIGLDPAQVEILGRLDDAWSGARHHVVPIVGWLARAPALVPNPREVAEILIADVEELLRPETLTRDVFEHEGVTYTNPVLRWDGGGAYGLTADLLLEALSWGTGAPEPGGRARLRDLGHYRRRQSDPVFPHGRLPAEAGLGPGGEDE